MKKSQQRSSRCSAVDAKPEGVISTNIQSTQEIRFLSLPSHLLCQCVITKPSTNKTVLHVGIALKIINTDTTQPLTSRCV